MRTILPSQAAARDDVLSHLSGNLRQLRQARGVSQGELALRAGLSRRMISAIESGGANVSLSTVDRLAAALAVKLTDLVRPIGAADTLRIESVGWRGAMPGSEGVLLGAAPGSRETELWLWSLAPGERYASEEGSEAWHEMLFVTEGVLRLERPEGHCRMGKGDFMIFSSREPYVFANVGEDVVRFVRNVVL